MEYSSALAMVIVRNDTLLYEKYAKGYERNTYVTTGSMIKSIINLLVGIAASEGKIKSVKDLVTDYLPEMKGRPGFDLLTIEALLNMTGGVWESENLALPTSSQFKFYYGKKLNKYVQKLRANDNPGQHKYSHTATMQLLLTLLERVTETKPANYLEDKIWSKIGAEYDALWSLDDKDGTEKGFCCFNARPIDFARLGKLVLDSGRVANEQIIPFPWLDCILNPDTTLPHIIKSKKLKPEDDLYLYNWWISSKPKPRHYEMSGIYGQKLIIFPKEKIIIATFNNRNGLKIRCNEEDIYVQIVDQLTKLKIE
jgi:CubicO group peptidase (beta-lactamase class C family)